MEHVSGLSVCPVFSVNYDLNEWFKMSGFKMLGFCDVIANHVSV